MGTTGDLEYLIVFADIAGSTQLYETVGDAQAKTLVTGLQNDISSIVERAGGHVQEIVGDEVLFRFDRVDQGVPCTRNIQEASAAYSMAHDVEMSVRIGLHFGPVIADRERLFGDTINIAARMVGIAKGGQIIASEAVYERLVDPSHSMIRRFDEVKVKGKQAPLVVYELLWQSTGITLVQHTPAVESIQTEALVLTYLGASIRVEQHLETFTVGRSPNNSLVVMAGSVSRHHAWIEFARGHFSVSDGSTNGTYVMTQDGETIYLRRETLPLWGHGLIGLGLDITPDADHVVAFHCEQATPN
jgi:hypothetical protein